MIFKLSGKGILARPRNNMVETEEIQTEDSNPPLCFIKHKEAMDMLDKCFTWLQHQPEAISYNTNFFIVTQKCNNFIKLTI